MLNLVLWLAEELLGVRRIGFLKLALWRENCFYRLNYPNSAFSDRGMLVLNLDRSSDGRDANEET